jgi:predicted ATPase
MMEYKIRVENFKSIVETEIILKKGLNILIGPNGAGKTNMLGSLKFIRDVLIKGVGLAMAIGGGPKRIYHRDKKNLRFSIEFDFEKRTFKKKSRETKCKWLIEIEQRGQENLPAIVLEQLFVTTNFEGEVFNLFSIDVNRKQIKKPKATLEVNKEAGKDLFKNYQKQNASCTKEKLFADIKDTFFKDILTNDFKKSGERSFLTSLSRFDYNLYILIQFFSSINEYNIIPERARQATEQLPYARLSSNGFGISEVIQALEKRNFHKIEFGISDLQFTDPFYPHYYYFPRNYWYPSKNKQHPLENSLQNINAQLAAAVRPIESVSVEVDQTNGKRYVIFKTSKETFYPDEVSDGTIKWLCILTSIYVGFSNIYLLEEPENFLHPWMQQKLIELMRQQSETNKNIYVLTTHSTTLLNAAYPEEVIIVHQKENGTEVSRINNYNEIQTFLDSSDFRLGDLWVSGGFGAVPI